MKERFEQAEKRIGEAFVADERKKFQAMVDRLVEAGAVPGNLSAVLKDPDVELAVRLSVTADRELKTGHVADWKSRGLYATFAQNATEITDADLSACVDAMLALATDGMDDPTFGVVPSPDDTSDTAMYTRRHPGKFL